VSFTWPGARPPSEGDVALHCAHAPEVTGAGLHVFSLKGGELFAEPPGGGGTRLAISWLLLCGACDDRFHREPLRCGFTGHIVFSEGVWS
jgi:hypothetical protein